MSDIDLNGNSLPCLVCKKPVKTDGGTLRDNVNWARAIECRSYGNFGSQIHDMDGCLIFVLCDRCVIQNRERMIHVERVGGRDPSFPDETSKRRPSAARHRGVTTGREHFESWFKDITAQSSQDEIAKDDYLRTVSGYFNHARTCLGCGVTVHNPASVVCAPNDPTKCLCQDCAAKAYVVSALARVEPPGSKPDTAHGEKPGGA